VVTFATQETENGRSFGHVLDSIVGDGRTQNDVTSDDAIGYGVKITKVGEDYTTDMKMVYDPSHPDADENGYVTYPNVNTVTEMTNLIDASRSYEANATAFQASKSIAMVGLDLSKN